MRRIFTIIVVFLVGGASLLWGDVAGKKSTKVSESNSVVDRMSQNYEMNSADILGLIRYTEDALNNYCGLQFVIDELSRIEELYVYNFSWFGKEKPSQIDIEKLTKLVGLTKENLDTIISKLKKANCRSIELMKSDGGYVKLKFYSTNIYGYYYRIYRESLTQTEIDKLLEDSPILLPYNPTTFLEYNPYFEGMDPTFPGRAEYMETFKK